MSSDISTEDMNDILMYLFWHYTNMIVDADIPDLNERFNILTLCVVGRDLAAEKKMPVDKGNRWVGYVQGILIAHGITTIDAERDFTRGLFEKHYQKYDIEYQSIEAKKYENYKLVKA